jgi:hypothetical protein
MEILCKAGNRRAIADAKLALDWRDGAVMDIRPDGFFTGSLERKNYVVIQHPLDFWAFVGCKDWRTLYTDPIYHDGKYRELLKYFTSHDANGRCVWEPGFANPHDQRGLGGHVVPYRKSEWFVDFQRLQNAGTIDRVTYESLYNRGVEHRPVAVSSGLNDFILHEDAANRLINDRKNMAESAGSFTVGTSQDYSTWKAAVDDIDTSLTGALTLTGNTTEEIADGRCVIDVNTNGHLLTLTVSDDHVHNGGAYGNGHRVLLGGFEYIELDNANVDEVTIEKLAIDCTGTSGYGYGIRMDEGGDDQIIIQRNVIRGNGGTTAKTGVFFSYLLPAVIIRNNMIYDFTHSSPNGTSGNAISSNAEFGSGVYHVYNNTFCKNSRGFVEDAGTLAGTFTLKNNLSYGNTTDYVIDDAVTSAKNVSGDSTSPDGATYQTWAGTANMEDYANDDFRLSATDSVLDDGDDLSAIGSPAQFSNDIEDQSRSTWFVGASEYVGGAPANAMPMAIHHYTMAGGL